MLDRIKSGLQKMTDRFHKATDTIEKTSNWMKKASKNPERTRESLKLSAKLRLRSMNNVLFAKKLEDIFLPSNVIIIAILALTSYFFIFGPAANPTFNTVLWFVVFCSWSFVLMEYIRKNADDPDKHNIFSLRVGLTSLIIPLMLMTTIELPSIFVFSVISFLFMLPLIFAIRSKWKISGHMCTFTAMSTIMSIFNGWFAPLFLMIPVISWCRIKLKAHTAAQVFVGTLLGFVIPYTCAFLVPLV